jgi:hypothetical protein
MGPSRKCCLWRFDSELSRLAVLVDAETSLHIKSNPTMRHINIFFEASLDYLLNANFTMEYDTFTASE